MPHSDKRKQAGTKLRTAFFVYRCRMRPQRAGLTAARVGLKAMTLYAWTTATKKKFRPGYTVQMSNVKNVIIPFPNMMQAPVQSFIWTYFWRWYQRFCYIKEWLDSWSLQISVAVIQTTTSCKQATLHIITWLLLCLIFCYWVENGLNST